MSTTIQSVEATIKDLLSKHAASSGAMPGVIAELGSESALATDLSLDSFAMMEILMEIEDHYDIVIDLKAVSDAHTLGDLARVVMTEMDG